MQVMLQLLVLAPAPILIDGKTISDPVPADIVADAPRYNVEPLKYKSFHLCVDEPKSCVTSVSGIIA